MDNVTPIQKEMIEKFQCCGCTCGSNIDCGRLKTPSFPNMIWCETHSAGTILSGVGKIALGMPKGFDKVGNISNTLTSERTTNIRLYENAENPMIYDKLNIPVWAMELEGYLFVRVIAPRINMTNVDVIKDGKIKDICPDALDVSKFLDEID